MMRFELDLYIYNIIFQPIELNSRYNIFFSNTYNVLDVNDRIYINLKKFMNLKKRMTKKKRGNIN
jgi:hypothetical protein